MNTAQISDGRSLLPCPTGYENEAPLPHSGANHAADQCRAMGIKVGDTIIGREDGGAQSGWFNESKLTLLFLGAECACWLVASRGQRTNGWVYRGESASWTLAHRKWYLAKEATP